jgi:hypothetical protein
MLAPPTNCRQTYRDRALFRSVLVSDCFTSKAGAPTAVGVTGLAVRHYFGNSM